MPEPATPAPAETRLSQNPQYGEGAVSSPRNARPTGAM
ncbi:MAG: hypothetical protein QOI67_207, partial [Gaiellaceae bacterium]|nr:hypothetical protein [Gaiellaceae bacterium]